MAGATWTPGTGGTGRWVRGRVGFNRKQPVAPRWDGVGVSEGGLGGFKKGVGFEGFWPTHTTAPRTSTTRRKNQGGGRRGEQGGGRRRRKREIKIKEERRSKSRRKGRENPEAGGRGIISAGAEGSRRFRPRRSPARRRSEGDRKRARPDAGEVSPAC